MDHAGGYRGGVDILRQRLPGLQIVGRCNGYWPEEKMDELMDSIHASGAEILFLAPAVTQAGEIISRASGKTRVCQGIGGTLDVIAGNVKRAPAVFCKLGLEWLYRLLAEPKRWRRQLVLPVFAWQVLVAKIKMMVGGQSQ